MYQPLCPNVNIARYWGGNRNPPGDIKNYWTNIYPYCKRKKNIPLTPTEDIPRPVPIKKHHETLGWGYRR